MFSNIIRSFINLYFTLCFSVICHEMAHFFIAKMCHFTNIYVCIGLENHLGFRTKSFFISPFIFSGYVSAEDHNWKTRNILQVFFYYFSGIIVNIIFIILGIIFHKLIIIFVNTIIMLLSAMPFKFLNSDSYNFFKEYKERRGKKSDV